MLQKLYPRVGLGIVVVKAGKILTGIRKGSHCSGQRCVPGGHLEFGESLESAFLRELEEETSLQARLRYFDEIRLDWWVANNIMEGKHYVGVFAVADWVSGEPIAMEPDKQEDWEWTDYDELLGYCKPGCAWLPLEFFGNYRNKII